jgi:hypothetical protein
MVRAGHGDGMSENNNVEVPVLTPVRDYKTIRKDALKLFLRSAAGSNEGLNKRAEEFREHVLRVLGPEVFKKDRQTLVKDLVEEAERFGRQLHMNPDQLIDFSAANPATLDMPLNRLLHVPASYDTMTGILADSIESIVVRIVLNSSPEDIQQALKKVATGDIGGIDSPIFHALSPIDIGKIKNWKFDHLEFLSFKYLDNVVEDWGNNASSESLRNSNELKSFIIANPPSVEELPRLEQLKFLKGSHMLTLSKVDKILGSMDRTVNTVGDVVTAALDTAIHENALQWFNEVGKYIKWKDRFEDSPNRQTDQSTKVLRGPAGRDAVPTQVS